MASFNRVIFSGSTDTIPVPFGYLDKSHVTVSLDGVALSISEYTWPSAGQVKITAGNPAAGVVGEARRGTPTNPLVDFEAGNLDTDDLDTASIQAIYLAEEAKDNTTDIVDRAWYTAGLLSGGQITKGTSGQVAVFNSLGNLVAGPDSSQIEAAQSAADLAVAAAAAAATFDPANFYTKSQSDDQYYTKSQSYSQTEVTALLSSKAPTFDTSRLVPSGAVQAFALSSAPSGWLKANGAAVSRTSYASLFAAIGTTFGSGDGSTTFNLPDLRGEFVRGWDDARGIDAGRTFGSSQLDAFQGHKQRFGAAESGVNSAAGGTMVFRSTGTTDTSGPVTDGTNGTPRTAAETRPRNVALLMCIKF